MRAKVDPKIVQKKNTVVSSYRFSTNFIWDIRYDKHVVVKKKKKTSDCSNTSNEQTSVFSSIFEVTMNINIIWLTFIREMITRDIRAIDFSVVWHKK